MLRLSGFELYSRWPPLTTLVWREIRISELSGAMTVASQKIQFS